MTHRDVSATVFGVTAGILIGIGSIAWAQHSALSASEVSFLPEEVHTAAPANVRYNMRTINQMGVPHRDDSKVRAYPTVKSSASSVSSIAEMDLQPETCMAVRAAIAKVKTTYATVTPVNIGNTASRQKMEAAFADALDDYCVAAAAVSTSSSSTAGTSVKIDNHCDTYPMASVRYRMCKVAEEQGNKYP